MVGGTAVLASVLWGGAGIAGADPKTGATQLSCGGTTYEVVVAGNGNWTPAHDTDSNVIFIPTWFGDFHGTVLDAEGNPVKYRPFYVNRFPEPRPVQGSPSATPQEYQQPPAR